MKNIFIPLGLSEKSITLSRIQYAIDLASKLGGTIYVAQVFKELPRSGSLPEVNKTLKEITKSSIEEEISGLDKKGVEVIALPLVGELLEAIPKFNLEHEIDLLVLGPETGGVQDPYFLCDTSGSLVKKTEIPVLIVPENYTFIPFERVLMALRRLVIKKKNALGSVKEILSTFDARLKLLLVKTPDFLPKEDQMDKELESMISDYKTSENGTLFQGVLEHLNENNPHLLCVFRRRRGFFAKLWEDNTILKKDFESRIPLLILRGSD